MSNENDITIQPITVQFSKGNVRLLCHMQELPPNTPDEAPKIRWVFNIPQAASQNGLPVPEGKDVVTEYYATPEDRDKLGAKLLHAIVAGRQKADELTSQVGTAFKNALPHPESSSGPK